MMKKLYISVIALMVFFLQPIMVFAQYEISLGVASPIVPKEKVQDGDIITAAKQGYLRSRTPYDALIIGVVNKNPALYFDDETLPNAIPLIKSGEVLVRVSTINGSIKKGKYITSSTIPGVGQQATDNGFVIGIAEQDYTEKDKNKIGKIYVIINPHYVQQTSNITSSFGSSLNLSLLAATSTPLGSLKYLIAGFIVIVSFFFGFKFFASTSRAGVMAIGRNPLAKQAIILSVVLNVFITLTVMLFGVAIAYLILIL